MMLFKMQVPQQPNGSDCGFYTMHFAKVFMEDPEKCRDIIWVWYHLTVFSVTMKADLPWSPGRQRTCPRHGGMPSLCRPSLGKKLTSPSRKLQTRKLQTRARVRKVLDPSPIHIMDVISCAVMKLVLLICCNITWIGSLAKCDVWSLQRSLLGAGGWH